MKEQKFIFDRLSLECSKKTTKSYSTSFSLAIKLLSREFQDAIYSIYGFVRLADEIVDSFHAYNKEELLVSLRKETVESIDRHISLNPIINSFQHTVRKYNIEWGLIDNFLESMEYDLHNKSCTDQSYKTYIRGSAEAVGLMCLYIFTAKHPGQYDKLKPYAESLGSAFQKINFLRDLADDYNSLDRVYFPNIDMNNFSDADKKNIEDDIAKDFQHALIGIQLLDKGSSRGVFLAYKYYLSLFSKIKGFDSSTIMKKRIRISNFKKILILIKSQFNFRIS